MDLESLRNFVHEHPDGVRMRMVDGRVYEIPHRDYITFGGPRETAQARRGPHATSFIVWEGETFFLVNALLVAEVSPLESHGGGASRSGDGNGRGKRPPGKGKGKGGKK